MTLTNSAGDLFAFWKPFIIDRPGSTPYAAGELYATSFDEAPLTEFFGPNLTDEYDGWRLLTARSGQSTSNQPVRHSSETIDASLIAYFQEHPGLYLTMPLDDEQGGWVIAYCPQ